MERGNRIFLSAIGAIIKDARLENIFLKTTKGKLNGLVVLNSKVFQCNKQACLGISNCAFREIQCCTLQSAAAESSMGCRKDSTLVPTVSCPLMHTPCINLLDFTL